MPEPKRDAGEAPFMISRGRDSKSWRLASEISCLKFTFDFRLHGSLDAINKLTNFCQLGDSS